MNKVIKSYPKGVCPDCQDDIPKEAQEGGQCSNCGHIFWVERKDDDKQSNQGETNVASKRPN